MERIFFTGQASAEISHLERIQRFATRLVTGIRHLPYEERLQLLGLHSLQRRRLRDDLITAFKIFKGHQGPLQGTPRCEPPPKERINIHGEGCEILE